MPVKDKYHNTVIRALQKDGWTITDQQVPIRIGTRRLMVDIEAVHKDQNRIILVEVKGFENVRSPADYLESAVGQYVVYRALLEDAGTSDPLVMAVPTTAYEGIFSELLGKVVVENLAIKLMVFDPMKERVTQWIL